MNATTLMYLAAIAAAIHVLLGALQSNSLNQMLAKFGIPALPATAMPWLGLVLGLGAGFVTGLQQNQPWQQALATALLGMLGGGASALHVESMVGNTHAAAKAAGGGGSSQAVNATAAPATPAAPPAAPVQKMIRLLAPVMAVIGLGVVLGGTVTTQSGCGWWSNNNKPVVTDVGQIASCVIAEMFQGVTDPLKITGACLGATLADVEQIIASIINYYDQPQEAGAALAASGQHCGTGQAPYGVPSCVSDSLLASFKTLHTSVKASIASGAK